MESFQPGLRSQPRARLSFSFDYMTKLSPAENQIVCNFCCSDYNVDGAEQLF